MADFTKEYVLMFKRWSDFEGKSNLKEFWMAILINFIITLILQALGQAVDILTIVGFIYSLVVLIPSISLGIRRLHDIGKSGWNLLWMFLFVIGWIYLIILFARKSE